jgi:hypothetical protein
MFPLLVGCSEGGPVPLGFFKDTMINPIPW